jgi:hypothetical protein
MIYSNITYPGIRIMSWAVNKIGEIDGPECHAGIGG